VLNGGIDDVNIRSTAAINPSKLLGYPSDPTKALFGDGLWKPPATTLLYDSVAAGVTFPTASITTPALDQSYKHLMIMLSGLTSAFAATSDNVSMRLNNDASANYYFQGLTVVNSVVAASGTSAGTFMAVGACSGATAPVHSGGDSFVFIPGYSGTLLMKRVLAFGASLWNSGVANLESILEGGTYAASTNAITSVTLLMGSLSNVATARMSVYGLG
jgi:hypothetical protein